MTCLAIGTLLIYSDTETEALQWKMAPETGTHRDKIIDTHAPGKIYTRYFKIYYVACVQFRNFSIIGVIYYSLWCTYLGKACRRSRRSVAKWRSWSMHG